MILETVVVGAMQANCYILANSANSQAIIIDPGDQVRKIRQVLDKHKLRPAFIINTHGHYDHIGCDDKFGLPVHIHKDDIPLLKDPQLNLSGLFYLNYKVKSEIKPLEEGSVIELDGMKLKVLHTPGHTSGGISLLLQNPNNKIIFTGDTLFFQGIGRTDMAGGNEALLKKAITEKLFTLSPDTQVYPGHGPSTTIADEKASNPFLI